MAPAVKPLTSCFWNTVNSTTMGNETTTLAAIIYKDPQPIAGLAADVPAELDYLILRCLRKDPGRRFQSTAELKAALALKRAAGKS